MMAVTDITHLAHITCPAQLRNLPGWLIWRYEDNDQPTKKPRKVPYYSAGGRRAGVHGRPDDCAQLVTFDAARAAAAKRGFTGVGFCPLPEFNATALDFDNCIDEGGTIHSDVAALLHDTYAEFSPSGHGIRAFFTGQLGNLKAHGAPFGFEVFSSKGFVTYTGNTLDIVQLLGNENTIAPINEAVRDLCRKRFSRQLDPILATAQTSEPIGLTSAQIDQCLEVLSSDLDYQSSDGPSWLSVGMALHHESHGEAFDLWDDWSSNSTRYQSREYNVERWNSFGKADTTITARSLVKWANENGAYIMLNGPASAEDFDAVATEVPEPTSEPMRFQVVPVDEFSNRPAPEWIVKGVVPKAELMVVFGESGSGKTFAVLDLVAAIARGVEWRGRRVKQGRVVYVAAEGAGGFRNRLKAYAAQHEIALSSVPMGVIADAPNLLLKPDALDICRAIKAAGGADVVVIDTFAQTTPGGNENSGEHVGKALAHCKGIHRSTGALVILVHHSGKDASKGARGWSGLRAAADAEIEVTRSPGGRAMRVSKQKDGEDGLCWGFDLDIVTVGVDSDNEPITSCIVQDAAMPVVVSTKPLGVIETIVNAVIQEFAMAQTEGIEVKAVIEESANRIPRGDGKKDNRRMRVRRALSSLTSGDEAPYWIGDDNCIAVI